MPASKPILQRLFTRLWRRPWFRRQFYHGLGLLYRGKLKWGMMNCGYRGDGPAVPLTADQETERLSYELYARLVAETPLAGRDVLELGAGRGGGARYLHAAHRPRRLVALDYAASTTRWCRRNFPAEGLEFVCGDAAAPPFAAGSFDVIVAVEVTHCLPDKAQFFASAARLLRPGGRLLVADFFYRRPDAMHALGKFEDALAASAFATHAVDDWTAGALSAIETDSGRRAAEIAGSVPFFLREAALGFTSTTHSSTYLALREGRAVYHRYVLERQES